MPEYVGVSRFYKLLRPLEKSKLLSAFCRIFRSVEMRIHAYYFIRIQRVARTVEDIVDGFCVAIVDEGVALRIGKLYKDILAHSGAFCKQKKSAVQAVFFS